MGMGTSVEGVGEDSVLDLPTSDLLPQQTHNDVITMLCVYWAWPRRPKGKGFHSPDENGLEEYV